MRELGAVGIPVSGGICCQVRARNCLACAVNGGGGGLARWPLPTL